MLRLICLILFLPVTVTAQQLRVVDGDTLVLGSTTYRINGIDAPEAAQTCRDTSGKSWQCGADATNLLVSLTQGKRITCTSLATDTYGRKIARCYAGEADLGREMVARGIAWAFLKFSDEYEADQNRARDAKSGIWNGTNTPAWEFRTRAWDTETQKAPTSCPIKGNISKNGKIYHTPWSPWYKKTKITKSKGERWFCNEAEALAAGWRPARITN